MSSLSTVDALMQAQFPTVMVPIIGSVPALKENGHRFLMANNGAWIQVKRSWLNAVLPITSAPKVNIPYGAVEKLCRTETIPQELLKEFGAYAKSQFPNECAARIIFNKSTTQYRLEKMVPISVDEEHVYFNIPLLSYDEELFVDIHSHGKHDAVFSEKDNKDDATEVKIAAVIGYPNGTDKAPTWCFRLCVNGLFENLVPFQSQDGISFKLEG